MESKLENFQISIVTNRLEKIAEYIASNYSPNAKFDAGKLTTIVCDVIIDNKFESSFDDIAGLVTFLSDGINEKRAQLVSTINLD